MQKRHSQVCDSSDQTVRVLKPTNVSALVSIPCSTTVSYRRTKYADLNVHMCMIVRVITIHTSARFPFCAMRSNYTRLLFDITYSNIRAATAEYVPFDICAQRRFRSACACAQSDQTLHCARFG